MGRRGHHPNLPEDEVASLIPNRSLLKLGGDAKETQKSYMGYG